MSFPSSDEKRSRGRGGGRGRGRGSNYRDEGGGRGNGGRGRGGGRGYRRGGGRGKGGRHQHRDRNDNGVAAMGDEEVLIAFMPHMRSGDATAVRIHEEYSVKGQRAFIAAAREYLAANVGGRRSGGKRGTSPKREEYKKGVTPKKEKQHEEVPKENDVEAFVKSDAPVAAPEPVGVPTPEPEPPAPVPAPEPTPPPTSVQSAVVPTTTNPSLVPPPGLSPNPSFDTSSPHRMDSEMTNMVHNLILDDDDDVEIQPLVPPLPPPMMQQPMMGNYFQQLPPGMVMAPPGVNVPMMAVSQAVENPVNQAGHVVGNPNGNISSLPSVTTNSATVPMEHVVDTTPPPPVTNESKNVTKTDAVVNPNGTTPSTATPAKSDTTTKPKTLEIQIPPKKEWQPRRTRTRLNEQPGRILANHISASPHGSCVKLRPRQELTAKWMLPLAYLRQRVISKYREKQEKKGLPIQEPQNLTIRDALKSLTVGLFRLGCPENGSNSSIISKEILSNPNSSESRRSDYPFEIDARSDSIWGTVPFYAPRTPGNVVLRLYFEDDILETLATGPTVEVCVSDADVEPTLRFILSNFKSKKGTVSISSLHSLSAVLDQFRPSKKEQHQHHGHHNHTVGMGGGHHHRGHNSSSAYHQQNQRSWYDGAGRAAWGCICEARKVLELAGNDYLKKRDKFLRQEEEYSRFLEEEEQRQKEEEEAKQEDGSDEFTEEKIESIPNDKDSASQLDSGDTANSEEKNKDVDGEVEAAAVVEKVDMKKPNYGENAANERKWKDIQSAFASILKSVLSNSASHLLLKRDLITKIRLEYELWCPLCELFAPNPFGPTSGSKENGTPSSALPGDISNFPHPVTAEHWKMIAASRREMQIKELGFVPVTGTLLQSLAPSGGGKHRGNQTKLQNDALEFFNRMSVAMQELYSKEYATAEQIHQRREHVRASTEQLVQQCDQFPNGTRVIIFGSSANGFGSPHSDLDMCLQLPPSVSLPDDEDNSGAKAMAKLAEQLDLAGLMNVDTTRLTARIPIVKFDYPLLDLENGQNESDVPTLECDLSMQNPLACLNTSLLLAYSKLIPQIQILASIIKRWAKSRDINNPSRHTLSSYGYIIMLLHFLTFSEPMSNGQVETIQPEKDKGQDQQHQNRQKQPPSAPAPIIPNLQWMDLTWPKSPLHTPYQEIQAKPQNQYCLMQHPTETDFWVNTHFNRLNDHQTTKDLQDRLAARNHPIPPLAILLASFFRYYAFEFDFKKHVVSLNSTLSHGIMEREQKAENDGWKLYGQTLSIEDPFETFYDVAHVLKLATFQRTKKEFAMAYSKIIDSVTGNNNAVWNRENISSQSGHDLIDWICEPLPHDD